MTRPARLPVEMLEPVLLDVPHPGHLPPDRIPTSIEPLHWPNVFGRSAPVEIEVGFGKGAFLAESAQTCPGHDFLGIEIERKYVLSTAARIVKLGLTNVRLACTDARWFLANFVTESSVDALHVYFPDPWWKKKHKKRKLFTSDFARQASRILSPTGTFHFATDVKDYYDESLSLVASLELFASLPCPADHVPAAMTNFEKKYRVEGRPIYRTRFVRP